MASIRFATEQDIDALERIENAADQLFLTTFQPDDWSPAPSGRWRAEQRGFILVAAEDEGSEAVGFVHVLDLPGGSHLEQVAVHPDAARRGHGRALVLAALTEAAGRGSERVTLRTYADLPWNAPFYSTVGFVESAPDTGLLRALVEVEERLGLQRYGRRIQMTASIGVRSPR